VIALIGNAYAMLTRCSGNTALSDLPNESRLRRQYAYDVARVLGAMHINGLDVDPEALAIARRYVDGEQSIAKLRAAISSGVRQFRTKTKYSNG
jgi:aminoglycoside phosphotransferase (APT) family kinase protein